MVTILPEASSPPTYLAWRLHPLPERICVPSRAGARRGVGHDHTFRGRRLWRARPRNPEAGVQSHRPATGGTKGEAELRRAHLNPARGKVYFYDTPELALLAKDLVLRARVTDGDDDDSTVKLWPLPLPNVPARWSATDRVWIELDVVGDKQVPSAKLESSVPRATVRISRRRQPTATRRQSRQSAR